MNETQSLVLSERTPPAAFLHELTAMHDIPLKVGIEVGRLKLTVGDFLHLGRGSVIELKKAAGEPFEIALNGMVVGKGEVIVVEQSSGVRVVEILKPAGAM